MHGMCSEAEQSLWKTVVGVSKVMWCNEDIKGRLGVDAVCQLKRQPVCVREVVSANWLSSSEGPEQTDVVSVDGLVHATKGEVE